MDLETLSTVVQDMIVQHDYPGFEPRSLKLGLPESINKMSAKTFAQALGHENVYVRLAALRWFQERPGMAKSHLERLEQLLADNDEWVRRESVRTIETIHGLPPDVGIKISHLLKDADVEVRKEAAKAIGKIVKKLPKKDEEVMASLRVAAEDPEIEVRWKAQKALRQLGEYE